MSKQSAIITHIVNPFYQAGFIVAMIIVLTLVDHILPHDDTLFEVNAGAWIVGTAMILLFIIINTLVALRIEAIIPYWIKSIICFAGLFAFTYAWSYFLSGKHIDEVGSFRWLWMVLTMVYLVFFGIVRSMKRIVDFAIKQDDKLRGE